MKFSPIITKDNILSHGIAIVNDGKRILNCKSYNTITKEAVINGEAPIYDFSEIKIWKLLVDTPTTHHLPESHIEFIIP